MTVRLTLACGASDRTWPLMLGEVKPAGIDLTYLRMYPEEVFWRMTRHAEFDAAEMSLSSYILRRSRGDESVMAIPVFTSREFRHSCVWVRADAGITSPEDLKQKRVGAAEWQLTANLWIRGFLNDDYGLRSSDFQWFLGGLYEPGRIEKLSVSIPGVSMTPIQAGQTLSQMLQDGDLEAVIGPRPPHGFPGPKVKRLFENYKQVEQDYFKRTGIFPPMHTVVIRREVLDRDPWVARSLYDAFVEAKRRGIAELSDPVVLCTSLPWQVDEFEATRALMGDDYWPYGLEPNRHALETLIRYSCEQGLAAQALPVETLFAPNTLDDYRI
jgi:4,5-dihydroxyphthalate decarboxylase